MNTRESLLAEVKFIKQRLQLALKEVINKMGRTQITLSDQLEFSQVDYQLVELSGIQKQNLNTEVEILM
jgi:hypothetical protein